MGDFTAAADDPLHRATSEVPDRSRILALGLAVIATTAAVLAAEIAHRTDVMLGLLIVQTLLVVGLVVAAQSARRQRELAEATWVADRRFRSAIQHSTDITVITDRHGRFQYVAPAFSRTLGYDLDELGDLLAVDIIHPEDLPAVESAMDATTESGQSATLVYRVRHRDGSWRSLDSTMTNLIDDPAVHGYICNATDITERLELEAQLTHRAFHDPLTGLPNRALFNDRLTHALDRSRRHGTDVAVLFIDLDGFKNVNDVLGHHAGDELLGQVAIRLRQCLRPGDTLARLGGDEFAALLEDFNDVSVALTAGERVAEVVRAPHTLGDREVFLTASVGVAMTFDGQESADQLLRNADVAMYVAKANGKNQVERFEPAMRRRVMDRAELVADLRHAIDRNEFHLQYQPTVDLATGIITGVEALIRWRHPTRGMLHPAMFVPLAEEEGSIISLGRWVLVRACHQARFWQRQHDDFTMSVNLSTRQLRDPGLVLDVATALEESGLPPQHLVLEVTETALMSDPPAAVKRLLELKALGVRLAIDDFGTGYSSLAQLQGFPVDIVKIDKAFVDNVSTGLEGDAFVHAIVDLANALNLQTVAEGVEESNQQTALNDLGCDLAQGYLFSRPLETHEIDRWLHTKAANLNVAGYRR